MNPEVLAACPIDGCNARALVDYSALTKADADAFRDEAPFQAARWLIKHVEDRHPGATVTVTVVAP